MNEPMTRFLPGRWGYFSRNGGTFTITDPATPSQWKNFLYNRDGLFYLTLDQRAEGPLYYNYEQNMVSSARNYVLRDEDGGVWSLNNGAAPGTVVARCRQLPGLSVFESSYGGIQAKLEIFVDPDLPHEINRLTLCNHDAEKRTLALTATHLIRLEGADNSQQLDRTRFDAGSNALLLRRYHSESASNKYAAFFGCGRKPSSYCNCLFDFLGGDVTMEHAAAWRTVELCGAESSGSDIPIFALRYAVELEPGEHLELPFVLGIADTAEAAAVAAGCYGSVEYAARTFRANRRLYAARVEADALSTPEPTLNLSFGVWTRLQLFHQVLSGRDGTFHNWRNNLQDAMGFSIIDPEPLRRRLLEMPALAERSGAVPRSTPKGNAVGVHYREEMKQRISDIGCWFGLAAAQYFKETGDYSLLDQRVFNPVLGREIPVGDALINALRWTLDMRGRHGLIRFLDGDWSDPLEKAGRRGVGESAWTAAALTAAIRALVPHLQNGGRSGEAAVLSRGADEVAAALNTAGWDGNWFIRGITDDGVRFCTSLDRDAKVPMLVQAWAILSSAATPEHGRLAMAAVEQYCRTPFGPTLYGPPFLTERPGIGRESAKAPGCGENGSCYTHGAMMLAAAEIKFGNSDRALHTILSVLPTAANDVYAIRRGSPLWWSNYYQSSFAAHPGRSSNIIASGAPGWFMLNIAEGLFGIIPEPGGLRIAPRLPSDWNQASILRHWRGCDYRMNFTRTGKFSVALDGRLLESGVIPVPERRRQTYKVDVTI